MRQTARSLSLRHIHSARVVRPVDVTAPGVTVLLKPFDLGRHATQGLTSPHQRGHHENYPYTVDLDDVGSVEATVGEHGRVEGLGAPCPGQRHDALQLAPTASLSVVMAYLSSPTTAAADRPQAMDHRNRSRRPVQWPRLNALSLVPPSARRPRPARVWDEWSGPRATRAPSTSPFVLGRAHFLTCLSARSEGPGLVGPVWPRPDAFPNRAGP